MIYYLEYQEAVLMIYYLEYRLLLMIYYLEYKEAVIDDILPGV